MEHFVTEKEAAQAHEKKRAVSLDSDSEDEDEWEWEEFVSLLEEDLPSHWAYRTVGSRHRHDDEEETKRERMMREQGGKTDRVLEKRKYISTFEAGELRSPIVVILGHVDTGKTTLLDSVRHSKVQMGEAGGITQQIGATLVPLTEVLHRTEQLRTEAKAELKLPGLVFIDTPGHESFSNMRVRGSSLCDVAVLTIDINSGLQPTTVESLKLLRKGQTRFIIALNKIDRLNSWKSETEGSIRQVIAKQDETAKETFDKRLREVRKELSDHGVHASLYWRCKDLDAQTPIVPICAFDGCGVPDLILLLMLYSQSVVQDRLLIKEELECYVLELQQAQGLGTTIDVLLINGTLTVSDDIMLCGLSNVIRTNIRALITSKPLEEMKGKKDKKTTFDEHVASATGVQGVKIWAKDLHDVVAGSRMYKITKKDNPKVLEKIVMQQLDSLKTRIQIGKQGGVRVHASTLGSLEALLEFLNENGVPIASVGLGSVNARDVNAIGIHQKDRGGFARTLLAFDVRVTKQATDAAAINGVEIIYDSVIYHLLDAFKARKAKFLAARKIELLHPCILAIEPAYVIKEYDPLILGVTVLLGRLEAGIRLYLFDGIFVGEVETIKSVIGNTALQRGVKGGTYIVQIGSWGHGRRLVYGRDIFEDDRFYTKIERRQFNELKQDMDEFEKRKFLHKYRAFLGFPDDDEGNRRF